MKSGCSDEPVELVDDDQQVRDGHFLGVGLILDDICRRRARVGQETFATPHLCAKGGERPCG